MKEVYRKFGRVVRRENALLVRVDEAGEAIERSDSFECAPLAESRAMPDVDVDAVNATAGALAKFDPERMIVSEGVAFHEFEGREWSERSRRIHLSIARPPHRALIDLADFDVSGVERIVDALGRAKPARRVSRVRLAPALGAALLPSLTGTIPLQQWAAPHDGKGNWIENVPVAKGAPPNWFRPSYRTRPIRAWFHLRAEAQGEVDRNLPEAIALLAPVHGRTLRVLCVEGSGAFTAEIAISRVVAITPDSVWYPFGAGCYGAELAVETMNDER
jgi:hypothetical protein